LVHADTFGSGANQFNIDFVTIGNPGNADDNTGYGSVARTYRMGKYEVSESMIASYNALSGGPSISPTTRGAAKPAGNLSWNEAARFVNWLNTSKGYSPAYKFTTSGGNDSIALWAGADAGYDASNPFRNSNAHYFLPSEDEWYKAAYYDPTKNSGTGGYWDYATGSDTAPTAVAGGTASGTAVYGQTIAAGPANVTNAGGLSPYGTMGQSGNVSEWNESGALAPNDSTTEARVYRGGYWANPSFSLSPTGRNNVQPDGESDAIGFRVASVPEPSAWIFGLLGMMGLVLRRKR
jgi:formylglycine-generating enzyme required for sulfatase activity